MFINIPFRFYEQFSFLENYLLPSLWIENSSDLTETLHSWKSQFRVTRKSCKVSCGSASVVEFFNSTASIHLPMSCLSIHLSVHQSINYQLIHPSIYPPIHPSIHASIIHPFNISWSHIKISAFDKYVCGNTRNFIGKSIFLCPSAKLSAYQWNRNKQLILTAFVG